MEIEKQYEAVGKEKEADLPPTVTATDVQSSNTPPSYEQVFGFYQTNVVFAEPELPPLSYIDVMPRVIDPGNVRYKKAPVFGSFSETVDGANVWLRNNPNLHCWKCESVERLLYQGNIDLAAMSHHESGEGFNVHVLGIRIWFVKKTAGSPVQQLGVVNVVPEGSMSDCISQLNTQLASSPLPGTILNVETETLKYSVGHTKFDPENTVFAELGANGANMRKMQQIIRIFYVKGPQVKETLSMHEIHPTQVRFSGSKSGSKLETFDGVVAKAQQWLQVQSGIRVVNIETRDVQAVDKSMRITIYSEKMDNWLSDSDCIYVKILRIFYVNTSEPTSYASTFLTSRLFVPAKVGSGYETMGGLMARIGNWLQQTQLPIFSMESVLFPAIGGSYQTSRVDYHLSQGRGKRWLSAVRLYFPQPFVDPMPAVQQQGSSSCQIL